MKVAKHDCYGIENIDGNEVRRFVRAGDPVPPNIVCNADDVIDRAGPSAAGPIGTTGASASLPDPIAGDYEDHDVGALQTEADRRGLTVTGTGKDGNVLKADLVGALEASD